MSRERVSRGALRRIRGDLSDRDLAILMHVRDLRLMSAHQIEAIHFGPERHASHLTATRTCGRVLRRLTDQGLLMRLGRRVGGHRAGSTAHIYGLTAVGHRVIEPDASRRRYREPGGMFADHTLAIGELAVALTLAARQGLCDLLGLEAEPACWRSFSGFGGQQVLRPDLFASLGVGDLEHRWFIEVDRGHEHLPQVLRKCRLYDAYYRSGREQAAHGVAPRTCWVVPDETRASRIERAITTANDLTVPLFTVVAESQALATLCGGEP